MKKKFSLKRKIPVIIFFITATISYFMIISNETKVGVDYQADAISKSTLQTLVSMSWAKGKDLDFFNEKLKQLFKSTYIIQSMHIRKMLRKTWF